MTTWKNPQIKKGVSIINGKYRLGKRIGKGGFGSVYNCYLIEDLIPLITSDLNGQYKKAKTVQSPNIQS